MVSLTLGNPLIQVGYHSGETVDSVAVDAVQAVLGEHRGSVRRHLLLKAPACQDSLKFIKQLLVGNSNHDTAPAFF